MKETNIFPQYIHRTNIQEQVEKSLAEVRQTGKNRALVIYGQGGRGKTVLLRNLSRVCCSNDEKVVWLDPIDMDDLQFWSLINLKIQIAGSLDPRKDASFKAFWDLLEHYPFLEKFAIDSQNQRIGGDEAFLEDEDSFQKYQQLLDKYFDDGYKAIIRETGRVVAIRIDTIEAIREFNIWSEINQWLAELPKTLLLLAGRPPQNRGDDALLNALQQYGVECSFVKLEEFSEAESQQYLERSPVATGLSDDDKEKIVLLAQGHPLWLALSIYYLSEVGIPALLDQYSLKQIRELPPDAAVFDEYIGELLTPYKNRDFWHEAILRLGILRQRMDFSIWKKVMGAVEVIPLPKNEVRDWKEAWEYFKSLPWVRERANRRYVTLQDAFAEELANRYIPKVDQKGSLRKELWTAAARIYSEVIAERKESPGNKKEIDQAKVYLEPESPNFDLYLLETAGLHYHLLANLDDGIQHFQRLGQDALGKAQRQLADLLVFEIQRFLPEQASAVPYDVEQKQVQKIQEQLDRNPDKNYQIIGTKAELDRFLGRFAQIKEYFEARINKWKSAGEMDLYARGLLWLYTATWRNNLEEGIKYLDILRASAEENEQLSEYLPRVYYLLGFSYRTAQELDEARNWLDKARETSQEQRNPKMLAVSLNLLAYINAIIGETDSAGTMIRQAISIRQQLLDSATKGTQEYRSRNINLAWSYNTLGEINRYRGKLAAAQTFYDKAQRIFKGEQEFEGQAIALQALGETQRRIALAAERRGDEEQSSRYWRLAENNLRESLAIYERHHLSRGKETAYRHYGRFLHSRGKENHDETQKKYYDEAQTVFKKGLELARKKGNTHEIIEHIQELLFLAAERGNEPDFEQWKQEIQEYEGKIYQWDVFPHLIEVAEGCLYFRQGNIERSMDAYIAGYAGLVRKKGYGIALYGTHRDRVFRNLETLESASERRRWLAYLKEQWTEKGLAEEFPGLVGLCDEQLLNLELFGKARDA